MGRATTTGATAFSLPGAFTAYLTTVDATGAVDIVWAGGSDHLTTATTIQYANASLSILGGSGDGTDTLSASTLSLGQVGSVFTTSIALSYAGSVAFGAGTTLALAGGAMTMRGSAAFAGAGVAGSQRLFLQGATSVTGGLAIGGTAVIQNAGTLTQSGGTLTLGDAAGHVAGLVNTRTGTYAIADASGIARGSASASAIVNQGLFEKTSDTGMSWIYASMRSSGTIAVAGGNLIFDGPSNVLSGTYIGPAMIDYGPDGASRLHTLSMVEGACSTDLGVVTQDGVVTVADGTTLRTFAGATWSFVADVGLALAAGSSEASFTNWGTLAKTAGTGTSRIDMSLVSSGTIRVQAGTLSVVGADNTLSGLVTGAGTLAFAGGSTTLSSGTLLRTAGLALTGSGTAVALGTDLSYAGAYAQGPGAVLTLGGALTLTGAATLSGASLAGSQHLVAKGTTTVSGGLSVNGTATLDVAGSLTQSNGTVTVGNGGAGAAQLMTRAGAVYAITDDSGIAAGAAGASLLDQGTLQKTGGGGTSVVGLDIANTLRTAGTVAVTSGTLELGGTLSGALALAVGAGATLVLDKAASAGTAATLSGATATLQLGDAQDYRGSVAGFAAGQTLDLRSIACGSATTLSFSGTSGAGTLTVSDGTNRAVLAMIGSYTQGRFALGSDGHGGSAITLA